MKKNLIIPIYLLVILGIVLAVFGVGEAITVMSESAPLEGRSCFIIDAGHGGIDGGAVSCTGVFESHINLSIALKTNDLLRLLGYQTQMIRTEDKSIHTYGESIAAKKSSDLKNRVRIVNETSNAILLSIHQNHYHDSYYQGGQMFYAKTDGSRELAELLQKSFAESVNPGNTRKTKMAEGIYLMKHIDAPGVLIECGFLSNYEEEAKLKTDLYQKKISCAIASACAQYIHQKQIT